MEYDDIELAEAVELKNTVEQMTKTSGWQFYLKLLATQIENRTTRIMGPPDKDDADMKNYLTGEVSGLTTAAGILESLHATAVDMMEAIKSEQEKLEAELAETPREETEDATQEG